MNKDQAQARADQIRAFRSELAALFGASAVCILPR
jgi:hypothetical protein